MKKMWLVLVFFVLAVCVMYYFRFYQITQIDQLEGESYNQFTGQWEKTKIDSKGIDPSKVEKNDNIDGLNNYAILKGYFNQYNEAAQTLNVRVGISFTQNALFEPTDLKLAPNQTIHCVPEFYIDPNTGKNYSLKNLRIPVKDGATLFVPGEKIISFTDFVERSNDTTFLLVQLTEDFDEAKTNYIQKIIVTGLCD